MSFSRRTLLAFHVALLCGAPAAFGQPFGSPALIDVDGAPAGVVTADIDGDHDFDLITVNEAGDDGPSLSILPNQGNGSFGAEERLNLAGSRFLATAVAAADFDGDGFGDLAVAANDIRNFPPTAVVLVYRNAGDGQFLKPQEYPLDGVLPVAVRAADFNDDGRIDLVVCHADGATGSGAVSLLAGQVGASFAAAARTLLGSLPSETLIGDIDADGHSDVVVVDPGAEALFLLYATTEGFEEPQSISDIGTPAAVSLGRTDALPSLIVANVSGGEVLTLEQTEARQFEISGSQLVDSAPSEMALLDQEDANGRRLLALASFAADGVGVVALGREDSLQTQLFEAPSDLLTVDLNQDGRLDLASVSLTQDVAAVFLAGSEPAPTPTATTANPSSTMTPPGATTTSLIVTATPVRTPTVTPTCPAANPQCHQPATSTATSTRTRTWTPTPTATATGVATAGPVEPGDANCDGTVDDLDGYAVIEQLFLQNCDGADLNGDGMVSSADVVLFFMGEEEQP